MKDINEWKERWNNGDNKFVPELFELVERYEKALKEIASEPFGNTSCNEIAIKYEVIAEEALNWDI